MEVTAAKPSLSKEWLAFHQENPKIRIRDAAHRMNTTEAQIVASFVEDKVVRLNNDFAGLWHSMPKLGYIMSLTRNEDCVHERKGWFQNVQIRHKHMGYVAGPDIDLRMFFSHWAFGFALPDDAAAGFKKSIQIFDRHGTAITKIFLQDRSNHEAFEKMVDTFKADEQSPELDIVPGITKQEYEDNRLDKEAFLADWRALKDTHDFFPMLRKHKVSRLHAVHVGEGEFARKVSRKSAEKLLYDASASGMPIMVFTGNNGNVQIHTGPVHRILEIPGWINVMDPEFNLHLRTDPIAECWVVRKPNPETNVNSLECYDKAGNLIVQFFGKRKPGIPEDPAWTNYLGTLA